MESTPLKRIRIYPPRHLSVLLKLIRDLFVCGQISGPINDPWMKPSLMTWDSEPRLCVSEYSQASPVKITFGLAVFKTKIVLNKKNSDSGKVMHQTMYRGLRSKYKYKIITDMSQERLDRAWNKVRKGLAGEMGGSNEASSALHCDDWEYIIII